MEPPSDDVDNRDPKRRKAEDSGAAPKAEPTDAKSPIGIAQQTAAALSSGDKLAVMSRTEKDKLRKRYNQSMEPSSERRPKAAKFPEHIALMIRAAPVKDGAYYFDLFCRCNGSWAEVELVEKFIKNQTVTTFGKVRWLVEFKIRETFPDLPAEQIIQRNWSMPS